MNQIEAIIVLCFGIGFFCIPFSIIFIAFVYASIRYGIPVMIEKICPKK